MKNWLTRFDEGFYRFLIKNVTIMPLRFTKMIANYYPDARLRKLYFKKLGVEMGENTFANFGMRVTLNENNPDVKIVIGKNVSIAPNVVFIADSCANNGNIINTLSYIKDHLTVAATIIIEDDVWIGANVTILPGITIGTCSVIGAGSVVTKDVEPYSIYAGIPAKMIRNLKYL
jgi:maltose O-acetyltransferase